MSERTLIVGGSLLLVMIALATMAAMHERHYRDRRSRILETHLEGLARRVDVVEDILREDRLT